MTNASRVPAWWIFLCILYAALLASITLLNTLGAEHFWPGAFNLYLPQGMWLVPGIVLLLCGVKVARRVLWLPLICLLWVLGPLMGFHWSLHPYQPVPGDVPLRVMTCNTKYGKYDPSGLMSDITRYQPDVLLFQDAGNAPAGLGGFLRDWTVYSRGQYVIASRLPLLQLGQVELSSQEQRLDYLRAQVRVGGRVITLYNVHIESPREGLNAFRAVRKRPRYFPNAISRFEDNVDVRLSQARYLTELLRQERGPVIVAGDLNSPDSSLTCVLLRQAGLHDAFAEAGKGYGYSYGHRLLQHRLPWVRISWMRIDHIMMTDEMHTVRCWTGNSLSSEHRPVIADLVLHGK